MLSERNGGATLRKPSPCRRVALFAVALAACVESARALDPTRAVSQYSKSVFSLAEGLPQASVIAIERSRDGELWIGTEEGFVRFDGLRFAAIEGPDDDEIESILASRISAIHESADGELWVGGTNGLARRDPSGRWSSFGEKDGLAEQQVIDLYRDRSGRLWVSTIGQLFVQDGARFRSMDVPGGADRDRGGMVTEWRGAIWVATTWLRRIANGESKSFEGVAGDPEKPLRILLADGDGGLWVGTSGDGLHRFDGERFARVAAIPKETFIESLLVDRHGSLWIGTLGSGVFRLRDGKSENFPIADAVTLAEDGEGNLWIGTVGNGLIELRDAPFASFAAPEAFPAGNIQAFLEDRRGAFWIGTKESGFHRWDPSGLRRFGPKDGLPSEQVIALRETRDGSLWIGTSAGLAVRRGERIENLSAAPGLAAGPIFSIAEDPNGVLWISSIAGISRRAAGASDRFERLGITDQPSYALKLLATKKRGLFAATIGGGLVRIDSRGETRFRKPEGLPSDTLLTLFEDSDELLWIGTIGGGLAFFDGATFRHVSTRHGLPSATVFSIQEDDAKNLWVSSNRGVWRAAKTEILRAAQSGAEVAGARLFGRVDGIRSGECNGGTDPASVRAADGRLWFATTDGVTVVDPKRLYENRVGPKSRIEEVLANDRRLEGGVSGTGGVEDDDRLEIRFTAGSFRSPEKLRFRYRLDDGEWIDAGSRRAAFFTSLPAGLHLFEVVATNADGVSGPPSAPLPFRVTAPFHRTPPFYLLSTAAAILLGFTLHRLRIARLERARRELATLVDLRTRDLASAKGELEEANRDLESRVAAGIEKLREAERFAAWGRLVTTVAHEIRHPIFAIRSVAFFLSEKFASDPDVAPHVATVDREAGRMTALMEELLDFARPAVLDRRPVDAGALLGEATEIYRAEHDPSKLAVRIDIQSPLPLVSLDRVQILRVVVNLMQNAFRHASGATAIVLRASIDMEVLRLEIENDGREIPQDIRPRLFEPFFTTGRGTGLGLPIVQRIVQAHGGTIELETPENGGARFRVNVPIGNEAPPNHG